MSQSTTSNLSVRVQEQVLVDLARWLARARQYSATHPSCAPLATETYATLTRALEEDAPLEYVIARDDVTVKGEPSVHPTIRTRVAPLLHARGARGLRFTLGISKEELETLVDVLISPPQKVADAGGLAKIARERGISGAQIEELEGSISEDERREHLKREELKRQIVDAMRSVIAEKAVDVDDARMKELLREHPEVAVAIVEEESRGGVAEGAAALAWLVKNRDTPDVKEHADRFHAVLRALSPDTKERILLRFAALTGELRAALAWALAGFSEDGLARFVLPAVRSNAAEPTAVLDALSLVVPRSGARLAVVRRVALLLYDLPDEENARVLGELATPTPEFTSFRAEREVLALAPRRGRGARGPLFAALNDTPTEVAPTESGLGRAFADLIAASATSPGFVELCARLPAVASSLEETGHGDASLGLLRGLASLDEADHVAVAAAFDAIVRPEAVPRLLPALDRSLATADGRALTQIDSLAKRMVKENPEAACAHLEETENRKMRMLLLDALPAAGAELVPLLRPRLKSAKWYVVRNFVQLLGRSGGTARDLMSIARHPDEKVRAEIVRALRTMPDDEVTLDIVIGYVTDPSLDVRLGARVILREAVAVGPLAVPRLERIARDEKQEEDLRRAALETLGRAMIDSAAQTLYRFMQPEHLLDGGLDAALREAAAGALRSSNTDVGRELFSKGLSSTVRRVRKACERAERGA